MTHRMQDYAIVILSMPVLVPVSVFIGALLAAAIVLGIAVHVIRDMRHKADPALDEG